MAYVCRRFFNIGQLYGCDNFRFIAATVCHSLCRSPCVTFTPCQILDAYGRLLVCRNLLWPIGPYSVLFYQGYNSVYGKRFLSSYIAGVRKGWVFILGLILLYGYYKATHPVYRYVDIQSDKVDGEVTIAFLSDIHLGAVLSKPFVQKLKVRLEQLGAQIVLFGGDIIDGNLSFVLKDGSLNGFAQLGRGQGRYMAV